MLKNKPVAKLKKFLPKSTSSSKKKVISVVGKVLSKVTKGGSMSPKKALKTYEKSVGLPMMCSGGKVHKAKGGGIEVKGKTKGRFFNRGGRVKSV